jgi:uncharacterized membrane protein
MVEPFGGFEIPVIHLATVLVVSGIIGVMLYAISPPVTQRTVVGFVPWMVSGSALHVFYQLGEQFGDTYPEPLAPLFSAPTVYLTTFASMALIWLVCVMVLPRSDHGDRVARYLLITGSGTALALIGLLVWQGMTSDVLDFQPVLPVLALLASLVVTFVVYMLVGAWRTYIIAEARYVGALALFAHLFDAITTAVGVDLLGASERSAIPRRILEFAAGLPTEATLGSGWLFVLVKLAVAILIIVAFADYVSDEPTEGNLLFALIIAVGLGPAVNNFFLFALSVGAEVPDYAAI